MAHVFSIPPTAMVFPMKQPCEGGATALLGHPEQGLIVNNMERLTQRQ